MSARLQHELKNLHKRKDLANFVAAPDEKNIYEWYFCVFGLLDCPYEDGFYVGKIIFPKEYPFKPPGLMMITPNGRFEERKRICTSFSDFHPELWDPSWSVQTIVLGLLSFMLGNEITVSSMNIPDAQRRNMAQSSLSWNFKNDKLVHFTQLFEDWFERMGIDPVTKERMVGAPKKKEEVKAEKFEPEHRPVLTVAQVDEMVATSEQDVLLLDMVSPLSGDSALPKDFVDKIKAAKLLDTVARFKFGYHSKCELVAKYGVKKARSIVLIAKSNPAQAKVLTVEPASSEEICVETVNFLMEARRQKELIKLSAEEQLQQRQKESNERALKFSRKHSQKQKEEVESPAAPLENKQPEEKEEVPKEKVSSVVARDAFMDKSRAWQMRKLHEQKELTGDWVFVLPKKVKIKCHSEVLINQSAQFKTMFDGGKVHEDLVKTEVKEFSAAVFKAMVDFMYLSEVSLDSNDLIEMLQLCQHLSLPKLKAAIEAAFSETVTVENFTDRMMLSRAFKADELRRNLVVFGKENLEVLQGNVEEWKKLSREDVIDLKQ